MAEFEQLAAEAVAIGPQIRRGLGEEDGPATEGGRAGGLLTKPTSLEHQAEFRAVAGANAKRQRKIDELEKMIGELHSSHAAKPACPAGKVC